jgi:hypothetical protein
MVFGGTTPSSVMGFAAPGLREAVNPTILDIVRRLSNEYRCMTMSRPEEMDYDEIE